MSFKDVRMQRKRKLSDGPADDFYKKKQELAEHDERMEEEAEQAAADTEIVEVAEEELVIGKSFNMKKFREKLRESDFIIELRHFLLTAADSPKIVGQYLKVGGKPLELVQALERIDKTQLFHISYIFQALQLTLIEVLSNSTQLTQPTVQACSYLLNSHRNTIEKLLYSNVAQHKRVVLKLLTAIVALEPEFGRDILTTLSVVFNAENLTKFTRHSKHQLTNDNIETSSVRTCYIHFILAYLIEGNFVLIRNLLDRNELVMAVVSGLIYDDCETVILVLSTLQRFVLKTIQVSKTKKVQVFNVNVVKELLQLYEWKGPGYFAALFNKKTHEKADDFIQPDELRAVSQSVHEFLSILLSSRKHGLAFQCLGFRRTKANALQKRILYDLNQPWKQPLKADLIIQILRACPELARSYIKIIAPSLETKNKQGDWFGAVDFFIKLIDQLEPSILRVGISEMNTVETIQTIKALCMSPEILQQLRSKFTIRSENIQIRFKSTKLLLSMFRQCNQHLYEVGTWNAYSSHDMRKIKFDLFNHIFVMCPSVEHILLSLHQTLQNMEDPNVLDHLEVVLDILLMISQSIPSFIEQTASVINYIKILRPIYDLNRDNEKSTRLELKAVKLILALEPKALSLQTEFFQQVIQSVLNVFVLGSEQDQCEARRLLRGVFQNTGLFENGALEVDLWLEAFREVDEDAFEGVRTIFVDALLSFEAIDPELRTTKIAADPSLESGTSIAELFANIDKGITLEGQIDIPVLGKFFAHFVQQFTADDEDELRFLDKLAVSLFHYLPCPNDIVPLLAQRQLPHIDYMRGWLTNGIHSQFSADTEDIFNKYYTSLVEDNQMDFQAIFSSSSTGISVKLNNENVEVDRILKNEVHCMQLLYVTMFVFVQKAENQKLDDALCTKLIDNTKRILEVLQQLGEVESKEISSGFEADGQPDDLLTKSLRYIFCSRFYLLNNFSIWQHPDCQVTRFVFELIEFIGKLAKPQVLDEISKHYRTRMTKQIEWAMANETNAKPLVDSDRLLRILTVFTLDHDHCEAILASLVQLPADRFLATENERTIYADLLAFALTRLAELKTKALRSETVRSISDIYVSLLTQTRVEANNDRIEDAFYTYLARFYHSIGDVSSEVLKVIFDSKRLNKSTIRLATILVERNAAFNQVFLDALVQNVSRKELVYPLLNVVCRKPIAFEADVLSTLFAEFRNGILKTIEKPQKASVIYKENIYSSLFLIERCMPLNECVDFCKKSFKFDAAETYQLQLIKAIHLKALHSDKKDVRQSVFENFLGHAVQLLSILLKQESLDYGKINQFATITADWIKLSARGGTTTYDKVLKSPYWSPLAKASLKFGLQTTADQTTNTQVSVLLKLLALLCDTFYPDGTSADDCGRFFDMTITHSAFFELALGAKPTEHKVNLMYLLFVLIRKNTKPLKSSQVPTFLAAYQAKMSRSDRFVLAILQSYEKAGVDLQSYKPFIWGDSAVSHYSIHGSSNENGLIKSNLYQEPPIMQVMSMIDRDTSELTLSQFPVWRHLNAIEQVPKIEFNCIGIPGNEHLDLPSIASNRLEHLVDHNQFDPELVLLNSRKEESFDELYDPAFFVPLMSMAFAPETFVRSVRPAQNGLLAMTFAALSSQDKDMRVATGDALLRYRSHLESAKFADSKIWFHLFECVQKGLGELTTEMRKHKKSRVPRVPFVAGLFLGRTINALINPLNEMYRPLSNFLLFQNEYNFLVVPEFNVLFNSSDVNHIANRHFMLEVLRDGIKCGSDFTILMASNIFKAVLGFYGTPMASRDTNLLVLTLINVSVKIPMSAKVLVQSVGLLPWLSNVIDNVEFFQFDIIDGVCHILNNLFYSFRFIRKEFGNPHDVELRLFNLLMKLCPQLSTRTSSPTFSKYLNVLSKVAVGQSRFISETNLDHLIRCAQVHLKTAAGVEHTNDLGFVKQSNEQFAEGRFAYVRSLRAQGMTEEVVFIDSNLREIILQWLRSNRELAL